MSFDKTFDRIATALERIADALQNRVHPHQGAHQESAAAAVAPPAVNPVPAVVAPPAVSAPPAPPAAVTPPPAASITMEQLNAGLVEEFKRLGSRAPIDAVMAAAPFNAQSIKNIPPEKYADLLAAVKALPGV